MKVERTYCHKCRCELNSDEVHYMADHAYCADCLNELTVFCHHCNTRIFRKYSYGRDSHRPLCEHCYDTYYDNCSDCGRLVLREHGRYDDNDGILCEACVQEKFIYSYTYKPEPIFYGEDSPLFMGVELELDEGGCDRSNAKALVELANANGCHIYIKNDGSLDEGFEIVTHPMTLRYHMERMPWKELMNEALSMGYCSHKANTCGLHCHVNRSYFGDTYEQQEENIGKVLFLVEKYWEELLRFSRRTQSQINQWAARYGFKEKPAHVLNHAKSCGKGRYVCINLENDSTIEFRMWRGTLKYNTLIATLQMVERLCKVAVFSSEQELQDISWWRFVSEIYSPELITYLKERQLYINEPVETTEEE